MKKNNSKIILLVDIYEEIVRLKKDNGETGYKARVAFKRIQYLLDSGLIISNGIKKDKSALAYLLFYRFLNDKNFCIKCLSTDSGCKRVRILNPYSDLCLNHHNFAEVRHTKTHE